MRYLIYFSLGNDEQYIKLLHLNLKTLRLSGYTGDILIITSADFKSRFLNYSEIDSCVYFYCRHIDDNLDSAAVNKLRIYEVPNIEKYDKFIFCDIDAVWLRSPIFMFEAIADKVSFGGGFFVGYVPLISDPLNYWGANLLSSSECAAINSTSAKAVNTGVFGFCNSALVLFNAAVEFIIKNQSYMSACMEQPFLNVFLWRHDCYDLNFEKYADNGAAHPDFMSNYTVNSEKYGNLCVAHFANGVGRAGKKEELMLKFLKIAGLQLNV